MRGHFIKGDNFHIIKPTESTHSYVKQKHLIPFREWIYIHHKDTFLHGPFDFATINGQKTKDHISSQDWSTLSQIKQKYDNSAPVTNLISTNAFHINTQYHTVHKDHAIDIRMA